MTEEFQNPQDLQDGDSGSANTIKSREDCADIRTGARQEDQLEGLHPGDDPDLKNSSNRLGCPPVSSVNNGSPSEHPYPTNEQKWPENKTPTK